jgi:hypothetical protein
MCKILYFRLKRWSPCSRKIQAYSTTYNTSFSYSNKYWLMWKAREKCNTVRKWTLYQEFTSPASLWHNHTIHQKLSK